MTISAPFHKIVWASVLGGLAGLGFGCVITVGPLDCSECGNTGCHSQEIEGECYCDPGHEFVSDDPNDFECDEIESKPGDESCGGNDNIHLEGQVCVCNNGFNWCNPTDLDDLTCCVDENQLPDDTDGNTSSDPTTGMTDGSSSADETGEPPGMCEEVETPWNGVEPDDADCIEDGLVFCSNNAEEGPAGSRYWECMGGTWTENTSAGDGSCQFDNFDFSYGCVDDGAAVTFVCGVGPGTACSGAACNGCGDDGDQILFCDDGKLGADSCLRICTEDGDAQGVTYDFGSCVLNGDVAECACCDEGDEGCMV